jgi:hypothetical protein
MATAMYNMWYCGYYANLGGLVASEAAATLQKKGDAVLYSSLCYVFR